MQAGGGGLVAKSRLIFKTPQTIAHLAALFMGFPRQQYWSGLPYPSPRDLPDPGIKPKSLALQVDSLTTEPELAPSAGDLGSNPAWGPNIPHASGLLSPCATTSEKSVHCKERSHVPQLRPKAAKNK